jgi:hypothetical protein
LGEFGRELPLKAGRETGLAWFIDSGYRSAPTESARKQDG